MAGIDSPPWQTYVPTGKHSRWLRVGGEVGVSLVASAGQAPFDNHTTHPTIQPSNYLGKTGSTINQEFADRFSVYVLGPCYVRVGWENFYDFSRRVVGRRVISGPVPWNRYVPTLYYQYSVRTYWLTGAARSSRRQCLHSSGLRLALAALALWTRLHFSRQLRLGRLS